MKKGPLWEKQVVEFLREHGFPDAERRVRGGARDRGDIAGVPGWTLEVKNSGVMEMGRAMAEAQKEADNSLAAYYAVIFKRRNHSVGDAYVVMTLEQLTDLMREW